MKLKKLQNEVFEESNSKVRYNLKGKAKPMDCEMAERSVVANKSKPMKAGNRPEGNAWMSMRQVA